MSAPSPRNRPIPRQWFRTPRDRRPRPLFRQPFKESPGPEQEAPAVPTMRSAGDVALRIGQRRLLDEPRDPPALAQGRAALDIAIAGLGPGRGDPEGHEIALLRQHGSL